ncbi:thermonuclease family protein [Alphaproteobacteria bacterium]|nr:thermonuclease family protein [Alphaproteobacteria bacterium]
MSLKILIFYFFSSIFFLTNNLFASHVTVVDGDTIKLGDVKIRFSGIDAPEINQTCVASEGKVACGKISRDMLITKVTNNKISCTDEGKDFYGRVLGECFVNGESLSRYLVREGFAFAYRKYSDKFISDEEYAKSNRLGMWSMKFQYPWDYRKSN